MEFGIEIRLYKGKHIYIFYNFINTYIMDNILYYTYGKTPIGRILLIANNDKLTGLYLESEKKNQIIQNHWQYKKLPLFEKIQKQLHEYLYLKRTDFNIAYKLYGTDFQINTWNSLIKIPYGAQYTYKTFTGLTSYPNAIRAVASAIANNPLSIVLPCHRVVRTDGSIGGYAGGMALKKRLLELEKSYIELCG